MRRRTMLALAAVALLAGATGVKADPPNVVYYRIQSTSAEDDYALIGWGTLYHSVEGCIDWWSGKNDLTSEDVALGYAEGVFHAEIGGMGIYESIPNAHAPDDPYWWYGIDTYDPWYVSWMDCPKTYWQWGPYIGPGDPPNPCKWHIYISTWDCRPQ